MSWQSSQTQQQQQQHRIQQGHSYPQQPTKLPEFKKRTEDDEDTLSLDSEKSQGYINEPVNSWPAWSVDQSNAASNYDMFARYPVNYPPQPINAQFPTTSVEPQQPSTNPLYASSQIPSIPEYFNRGPVFTKPQTSNFIPPIYSHQPVYNYQPQQNLQQQQQQTKM